MNKMKIIENKPVYADLSRRICNNVLLCYINVTLCEDAFRGINQLFVAL